MSLGPLTLTVRQYLYEVWRCCPDSYRDPAVNKVRREASDHDCKIKIPPDGSGFDWLEAWAHKEGREKTQWY